jgi:ABC-type transport system involved in multi-copper enzyme maturation permease subunit
MTFLPIVERELRVRARLKSTYRFRLFAALGAIVVVALLLLASGNLAAAGKYGVTIFTGLAWLSFGYCLLDGARSTADCLSEEKREGTLGLLFLTDLRPYDVVLGKLMAASLNSFYGLLAIFPPLAIPLILGGVTGGEFWRLVLVLINTLFFSVTAGMMISAASRDERRAWFAALGLLLFFAAGPALLLLNPASSSSWVATLSPTTGFLSVFDAVYSTTPERYWDTFWNVHILGWIWLVAAVFILPRAWQDKPMSGVPWWRRWLARDDVASGRISYEKRSLMLDGNPVVWLVLRGSERQTYLWLLVILAATVSVTAWGVTGGATMMSSVILGVMILVHLTIAIWVASEACHLFSAARDSGAFELLLSTPLTAREIVEGHVLGLRRVFYRPVVILLAVEAALLAAQLYVSGTGAAPWSLWEWTFGTLSGGLYLACAVMDLIAVARYGLWQGLAAKKPAKAVTRTVLFVLVLPLFLLSCTTPVGLIIKDLIFINYAKEQLRRQFRVLIAGRFGWAEESEYVGQPSKRALANPLPRVYPS